MRQGRQMVGVRGPLGSFVRGWMGLWLMGLLLQGTVFPSALL